ncbi:MAG: BREX-1 system phosphatase PglZ type A [Bacilli bacterium]|nr:BREX-1 system phosphatase PglZ type A [Bacilli bacterium]
MISKEIQDIKQKLNTEFEKENVRLIFWYDEKKEYEEDIDTLELKNAKIHKLNGKNFFYTKYLLEELDKDSKYLIYAPFKKGEDKNNHLADMHYYSLEFYTDRLSQLCQELNIPSKYKAYLEKYNNFWKSKERISKFTYLNLDNYNEENINVGILSVLTNIKTANFEEVLTKIIIYDDYSNSKYLSEFSKMNILDTFWLMCKKYFGYFSDKPSIYDFVVHLIITYFSFQVKDGICSELEKYVLPRVNDAVVFVKHIMDNILYSKKYDEIADNISETLVIYKKVQKISLSFLIKCDSFALFDELIISWIKDKLENDLYDEKINDMSISEICEYRMNNSKHFYKKFYNEYKMLNAAYNLIKKTSELELGTSLKDMIKLYDNTNYKIDSYYRWFYKIFDELNDTDKYENIRILVENIYSNDYLSKIVPKWNEYLSKEGYDNKNNPMAKDFYKCYVKPHVNFDERIIVIISDALRYECAKELVKNLEYDEKCEANIESVLSVLPSYTQLGMAALLPHNEIHFDDKINVLVDDKSSNDLVLRQKILNSYVPSSACFRFDEIAKSKRDDIREKFKGKNIIYIYHNQIDGRGEELVTENEVFNACSEGISEIQKLIRKLSYDISANKYIVTADHGFIYKRDKLSESDKVSINNNDYIKIDKRYILSNNKLDISGTISLSLKYLGDKNNLYVTTPIGADVFKSASGGQNYVHGGSSIQEMLIPVVQVKTSRDKQNVSLVNVELTSITRKITNLITYLDFIQTEKVTDIIKARNVIAYFITESGEKISFDVPMMANSKETSAQKRIFHEKFTFKSRNYLTNEKYYLVIVDANDENNILNKYEFDIDIAFANDFGF